MSQTTVTRPLGSERESFTLTDACYVVTSTDYVPSGSPPVGDLFDDDPERVMELWRWTLASFAAEKDEDEDEAVIAMARQIERHIEGSASERTRADETSQERDLGTDKRGLLHAVASLIERLIERKGQG
jgi:hypothetical protein